MEQLPLASSKQSTPRVLHGSGIAGTVTVKIVVAGLLALSTTVKETEVMEFAGKMLLPGAPD